MTLADFSDTRGAASWLSVVYCLLISGAAFANPQLVAQLALEYQQSQQKWVPEEQPLFGKYLGSGDGSASGTLAGRFVWDLYEDQSRDDRHPMLMRGFIERDGRRYPFQILGVFTREAPDNPRRWLHSGTIVFDDSQLLGTVHAPVTGTAVQTDTWRHQYTVWVDREAR